MADQQHVALLRQGVEAWNRWRREEPEARPDLSQANLMGMHLDEADLTHTNLFGADRLLWSVPDELLPNITTPLLVLQGDDVYHPRRASLALGEKVATATLIERWKEPEDQPAARAAVDQFLAEHAA